MYAQLVRSEITFTLLPTFNLITLEEVSAGELFTVELVEIITWILGAALKPFLWIDAKSEIINKRTPNNVVKIESRLRFLLKIPYKIPNPVTHIERLKNMEK